VAAYLVVKTFVVLSRHIYLLSQHVYPQGQSPDAATLLRYLILVHRSRSNGGQLPQQRQRSSVRRRGSPKNDCRLKSARGMSQQIQDCIESPSIDRWRSRPCGQTVRPLAPRQPPPNFQRSARKKRRAMPASPPRKYENGTSLLSKKAAVYEQWRVSFVLGAELSVSLTSSINTVLPWGTAGSIQRKTTSEWGSDRCQIQPKATTI